MQLFSYPCTVRQVRPADFEVRFADVPEVLTFGDNPAQALDNAAAALACAIEGYLRRGGDVPAPRAAAPGEHDVALDPNIAARVVLQRAMKEGGVSNVALAQRMRRDEKAVRRILSGQNASFSLTLDALKAVGVRPALSVV